MKCLNAVPSSHSNVDHEYLLVVLGLSGRVATGGGRAFRPNLETLDAQPQLARSILRAMIRHRPHSSFSHCLTPIGILEPRDSGGCSAQDVDHHDVVVDDLSETPPGMSAGDETDETVNFLGTFTNVRSLTVRDVCTLVHVDSSFTAVDPRRVSAWTGFCRV